ncbi:hypothetical protein FTUN_0993 [Frigoriglobus tundricola]|uniref:Uncharacterized protein n=1 Tax=Frigoriglobus tundricola TaxID=2774151 RepID=A0A6M5YHG6_9BACT|nr:hypothetical protein FTUN_0993 [Frigoriglobus tundricola]
MTKGRASYDTREPNHSCPLRPTKKPVSFPKAGAAPTGVESL